MVGSLRARRKFLERAFSETVRREDEVRTRELKRAKARYKKALRKQASESIVLAALKMNFASEQALQAKSAAVHEKLTHRLARRAMNQHKAFGPKMGQNQTRPATHVQPAEMLLPGVVPTAGETDAGVIAVDDEPEYDDSTSTDEEVAYAMLRGGFGRSKDAVAAGAASDEPLNLDAVESYLATNESDSDAAESIVETPHDAAHRIFAATVANSDKKSLTAPQIVAALRADGHAVTDGFISGIFMGESPVVSSLCVGRSSDSVASFAVYDKDQSGSIDEVEFVQLYEIVHKKCAGATLRPLPSIPHPHRALRGATADSPQTDESSKQL
jgi:hypothetical protein